MSIKKEDNGRRSIQVEIEVPGTPEEVWQAIASGPGISSWFVPTKSDEREGGQIVCNFGPGMDCPAKITAWQAPRRFVAEGEMAGPGSPTMASEWSVEARAGGMCVVRVVNSLFATDDNWDNQLDGLEQGWPTYFRILRMRLSHFRGLPCAAMQFVGFSTEAEAKAWDKFGGALGLLRLAEGQNWQTPAGVPRMAGVVECLGKGSHANTILLRLSEPTPGSAYVGAFSCGGMVMACMSMYLYGDQAKPAVARDEPTWQQWIGEKFPMPQG